MPPLPSTAKPEAQFQVIEPHGETHDEHGVDPVLQGLRVIELVTIGAEAIVGTTLETIVEFDIIARGGTLIVDLNTNWTADAGGSSANPEIDVLLYIDGSFNSMNSVGIDTSGEVSTLMVNSGVMRWIYFPTAINPIQPLFGTHTLKLMFRASAATVTASYAGGHIIVYEFNPVRRD